MSSAVPDPPPLNSSLCDIVVVPYEKGGGIEYTETVGNSVRSTPLRQAICASGKAVLSRSADEFVCKIPAQTTASCHLYRRHGQLRQDHYHEAGWCCFGFRQPMLYERR